MIKLKRLQLMMTVIPLLLAMTLFSVGFAGWVSVAPAANSDLGGTIHSYGVTNSNKLVQLYDMKVFKYRAESFLDDDGNLVDEGKITVTCTVNPEECALQFGEDWNGSLKLHIVLRVANVGKADLFNTEMNGKAPASYPNNKYQYSISATVQGEAVDVHNSGTELTIEYGFKTSTSVELQVEYTFAIPKNLTESNVPANFRHCFGMYLQESGNERTKFISSAWAEKS